MAWLAVDKDGNESIYSEKPIRCEILGNINMPYWKFNHDSYAIFIPKGSIKKLIGKELTWNDEPFEIK